MRKDVRGTGWLKGGIYENINVEGTAFSICDIVVRSLSVSGSYIGKKVKCEDSLVVKGAMCGDIHFSGGTHIGIISGDVTIKKQEGTHIILKGDAEIRGEGIVADTFRLEGRCRIARLEANTVELLESKFDQNHRNNVSTIDEIVCKKLKAYNLNVKKVIAEEVELYGKCKIGTLIYKEKKCTSPDCVIENGLSISRQSHCAYWEDIP